MVFLIGPRLDSALALVIHAIFDICEVGVIAGGLASNSLLNLNPPQTTPRPATTRYGERNSST